MNTREEIHHGGRLCGEVRYEAVGAGYNVSHCHCVDCRRSSGAPFVTWVSFRREDFIFTKGEAREIAWAGRVRRFCGACGTPLIFMAGKDAVEVDVTVCSLDEPTRMTPTDHTWVEDRLPWITLADGIPSYAQARPDHEG